MLGKQQILAMWAAVLHHNSSVTLLEFNDRLEVDGNLPIPLQQHGWLDGGVLPSQFRNLHTAFAGVPAGRLQDVVLADDRVLFLPGQTPAGANTPVLFSGYSNVTTDRSLFYLLVHSTAVESEGTAVPLIIWLQGGNGCSSLLGAFSENGSSPAHTHTTHMHMHTHTHTHTHMRAYVCMYVCTSIDADALTTYATPCSLRHASF